MEKGDTYQSILEKYDLNYKFLSVCFSGYRPEKFNFPLVDGEPEFEKLKLNLKKIIISLIEKDKCIFYIGLAEGFDIVVGEILLSCEKELGVILDIKCVLPYINFVRNFSKNWYERANYLINTTNRLKLISNDYHRGVYYKRNRYMVDNSRILVCYYDGKNGGTKYTLDYAKKHNLHIINIYNNCEQLTLI